MYKYLKLTDLLVWGTNVLTIDDLVNRKEGRYDHIIDVESMKQYDPEKNEWVSIAGETQE